MDDIDRRIVLRSMLGGVVAAGLGTGLLAQTAEALPLTLEKYLVTKANDTGPPIHQVDTRRRPGRPRPPPPPPRRHWRRRRRWTCWWHRGRRHCGWR
ncbi:hypothetical protein H8B02_19550 [Bradyrhizobium sp. Pear77]|uniref:hypothetical protein n=1 Tax=Bradyrhizobium altum TaxID=1571202 RepID=UPI001E423927|nr:hypothetical protein [Bradyrhizobium altum]MCC8955548.1 hypothetical protein [Bradyrhizobium altum]